MPDQQKIRKVLFVQKHEVINQQRPQVCEMLGQDLGIEEIAFASSPTEVEKGTAFDAIITPTVPWLPDLLKRVGSYRWIHFLSSGVDKIWEMDFDKQSPLLTKSSGVHGPPMSEYAIGAMLYFAKQFGRFRDQSGIRCWERTWLDELAGKTLAILGLGSVGRAVAQRAKSFGMEVFGTLRRPRHVPNVDKVLLMSDLRAKLAEIDFLVVCLPLTSETLNLINNRFLENLKPGAVLVDISRGGIVSANAVIRALDNGQLKGAALDVFEEQPLPLSSPLWARSDILLTPHVAGTTPHYIERALEIFIKNAKNIESGNIPLTPVDIVAGY